MTLGRVIQGIMFGYASNDTPSMMPAPIHYSHEILKKLKSLRVDEDYKYIQPDSKSQVSVQYEGGKVKRVDPGSCIMSTYRRYGT